MMLVQNKILFHIAYWSLCTVKPGHCVVITSGLTCESSNVLPQGCDEFSGPQILYYLKSVMNFQFPKYVIYVKSDRFLAVVYLMPACQFYRSGYLVIACGSLTSSATYVTLARALNLATKIKVRGGGGGGG